MKELQLSSGVWYVVKVGNWSTILIRKGPVHPAGQIVFGG
jgi:hypothetical protein